ncbi:class I SAM-dependent methyltransferase [Kistimonas asteriae]|uniref:class I SAM-dependent methyltransferase n=1 Tax=Kistimonas asteriae TaxID=517724 RepID=UPI001BA5FAE9|nr:class I SAM-dependent methyltransferase [Kistimonas asteriae]
MNVLTNPSQLLVKNSDVLEAERILVIQPENDGFVPRLCQQGSVSVNVFTTSEAVRSRLVDLGVSDACIAYGECIPAPEEKPDTVILYLQKSREFMSYLLAMSLPLLTDNGRLLLVGENGSGIKSWQKRLAAYGDVEKIDSARHCSLYVLTPVDKPSPFVINDWKASFEEVVHDVCIMAETLPGVFNHGRLDVGTRLLLETMEAGFKGDVLDFGCGSGVVGAWLAKRFPGIRLSLLDNDAMALAATRETCRINDVDPVAVIASNGLESVRGRFNAIVSNPPFHEGVKTQYETTEQFLKASKSLLKPKGRLRIVANSFLRYPPIIETVFGHCHVLAKRDGFTVYEAING